MWAERSAAKANLNIPQLETAQCSTLSWISRQSSPFFHCLSFLLPPVHSISPLPPQMRSHICNKERSMKHWSEIPRKLKREWDFFFSLSFSHTLPPLKLILHSAPVISFSSYRLNMISPPPTPSPPHYHHLPFCWTNSYISHVVFCSWNEGKTH